MNTFKLSEVQAQAILDMRLHQLTQLTSAAIEQEQKDLLKLIAELQGILADPQKILDIIVNELAELKKNYGDPRRTEIGPDMTQFSMEDLIEKEDVVITISNDGYAKTHSALPHIRARTAAAKALSAARPKKKTLWNICSLRLRTPRY